MTQPSISPETPKVKGSAYVKSEPTMADHDLVEAAALELEDLRRGPLRSSTLSPSTNSPPSKTSASFDSADSTASPSSPDTGGSSSGGSPNGGGGGGARRSSDGCYGDGSSHGVNYRRANTVAVADTAAHSSSGASQGSCPGRRFPTSCLRLVRGLPGNSRCVDCDEMNPEWASVSYGVLLCLRCSGRHRGLGVNVSVKLDHLQFAMSEYYVHVPFVLQTCCVSSLSSYSHPFHSWSGILLRRGGGAWYNACDACRTRW